MIKHNINVKTEIYKMFKFVMIYLRILYPVYFFLAFTDLRKNNKVIIQIPFNNETNNK